MSNCKICKKILSKEKYEYCLSCSCKRRYKNHPENNPMYGKHLTQKHKDLISKVNFKGLKYYCKCGKEKSGPEHEKCWKCELEKRKIPSNNGRWLGGLSQHPYTYEFNIILKNIIRKRDNHKCQKCGKKEKDLKGYHRKLTVHHIDYNKCNCKLSNLLTLCRQCNGSVNKERDYWFAFFTYIMENRNA